MHTDPEKENIHSRLTNLFRDVFNDDAMVVTESTSAENVPEWDSLMHVTLCVAVEKEFGIKLNALEIASLSNVGKLADILTRR